MPSDQSTRMSLMAPGQAVRASAPVKVWTNVAFESRLGEDIEDDTRATALAAQAAARSGGAGWANSEPHNARTSTPGAELRHSVTGAWGASSSPRPRSPRFFPGQEGVPSPIGHRTSQTGMHRLSQTGSAMPSPSSRVSAAGSEIYPLGQLFTHNSGTASPTNGWTCAEEVASREGSANSCNSRSRHVGSPTLEAWHFQVKQALASELRLQAVTATAPATHLVRCYIRRSKGGLLGGLAGQATYRLFLEDGDMELMSATKSKQLVAECPSYTLFYQGDATAKGKAGVAKLSPNSSGSQYQLRGNTPGAREEGGEGAPLQLCISFEEQCSRSELRSMHCLVPVESTTLPTDPKAGGGAKGKMAMLCTRQPDYDESTGFTLPVVNRYFQTSIKNFQLVQWHLSSGRRGSQTLLQFGKLDKDLFALDFAAPLCAKTAFAIALAATEAKYLNSNA